MEKLPHQSPDLTNQNIQKLLDIFPDVSTEIRAASGELKRAIDFDQLRQALSGHLVEGPQERYQLDWPGKRQALLTANAPIAKTLRPVREESVDFDNTKNLFIEGDNLDALKLLQESYLGKVKLIYIDPPYNTGNDFIYEDDFAENIPDYLERSEQIDDEGNRLRANPESNGRFHSDWLSMMYPRLKLARTLMSNDGVFIASIDQNEVHNLRKLLDEVFGPSNFVADLVWSAGRKNDSRFVSESHEYVLIYCRDQVSLTDSVGNWRKRKDGLDDIYREYERLRRKFGQDYESIQSELRNWFKGLPESAPARRHKHYRCVDERGIFFAADISWPGGGGPKYDVIHPVTGKPVAIPSRGFLYQEPRIRELIADDRVLFGPDETSVPTFKAYLKDREDEVPYSVIYKDGRAATKRLRTLMESSSFTHPKDEEVLRDLIQFAGSSDGTVLDFFAGSSSTAHATMLANALDGGSRRFVMVQIPEPVAPNSTAAKAGFSDVASISKERIRRAGKSVADSCASPLDSGFRVFTIDDTNFSDISKQPDELAQERLLLEAESTKLDRSPEDLLFECLIRWGLEVSLTVSTEQLKDHEVLTVEDDALIACFEAEVDSDVVREIARREPLRAVFRDSGFSSDAERINAEQIFKEISPATEVKVI